MPAAALDFFYDLGSPYSYLASTQLRGIEERTGAKIRLHPITLGGLRKAVGTSMPSALQLNYMSQDVQLWARRYGVPMQIPSAFPTKSIQALRACLVAEAQGRQAEAMHALFRAYFAQGRDIAQPEVVAGALKEAGFDAGAVLAAAEEPAAKDGLRQKTELALARGVFGVPTFFVGDQHFFGNDRLEFVEAALRGA